MAVKSAALEFDAENGTPQELISRLKSSFRDSDFAEAESILIAREAKLKLELEAAENTNKWLKKKLDSERMEKLAFDNKLKKNDKECQELQQLNSQLSQGMNVIREKEKEAEKEVEIWKSKYQQLETRILKLEEDTKLLLNVEPNVGVSGENSKNVELGNGRENDGHACDGDERPPSRSIVEIIDSDDDRAPGENLAGNKTTSPRVPNSALSGQKGGQNGTGMLKRKLDSFMNISEEKNSFNDSDNVKNVVNNSRTADCTKEKRQKLIHEHDRSPVNHCTEVAVSPRSSNAGKFCASSSQEPVTLRQGDEKMKAEQISQNLKRGFPLDLPAAFGIEDTSSSSSSSSDSDDDVDMNFDFSQLMGKQNDKKWEFEAGMLAAIEKDNELR